MFIKRRLNNMKRIAVITGASSGFGSLLATKLDKEFSCIDEIYLIARRKDRLEELKKVIAKPCKIIDTDLSVLENVTKIIDIIASDNVKVKILANCAGFGVYNEVIESSTEDCTGMIDVNCKALTILCKEMIPFMSYNSRIINFASSAAFLPQKNFAVYAATKAYVLHFTRALNEELKSLTIHCTAVCPGPADTEFFDVAYKNHSGMPGYKKLFMADAKKVVDKAVRDAVLKKDVSVYGLSMNAFKVCAKILPHKLLFKFI